MNTPTVTRGQRMVLRDELYAQVLTLVYAHMLIVVAFLVVNFFSFLVIAPSHELQSGRK